MSAQASSPQPLRAWITGASSGIGRATALEFAKRGCRVALSARNREALESLVREIGEDRALALPLDAADRDANLAAAAEIERRWGGLDLAFFNAGDCEYVEAKSFESAPFERMMRVNFLGMVYGVEAALPLLRRSPRPHLAGMSSAAVHLPFPRAEAYGASKAAAAYFLESLRIDLKREGIPVSIVFPGFVRTPLTARNDFPMPFMVEAEAVAIRIASRLLARQNKSHRICFPLPFSLGLKFLSALPDFILTPLMARLARG